MEHNHAIDSTYVMEQLRDITDNDLDALLHFDSPPPTLSFSHNSEQRYTVEGDRGGGGGDGCANLSLSFLQFNREPLPSQMSSHVDDINNYKDELDFSLNFSQNDTQQTQSVLINTGVDSVHLVHDTEINETPSIERASDRECEQLRSSTTSVSTQDLTNTGGACTIKSSTYNHQSNTLNSIDEIIKKELLDKSVLEDFYNDNDFADFKDFSLDNAPPAQQNAPQANGTILNRICQTQVEVMQHEPPQQMCHASCPELIRVVEQSPALPSTISGVNQMNLSSTTSNIQIDDIDYTREMNHEMNPLIDYRKNRTYQMSPSSAITPHTLMSSQSNNNSTADSTMVPASVKQLYDLVHEQYTDFAFVYALSAQLCQDRVPMDCYVNLKMGLLLSLASISLNPDRPPVPIMAFGSDTYMANFLLTNVGQLAARFAGPAEDVKPPSSTNYLNCKWLEADPIVLAKGGVFFVGDWSRLKLARADNIFRIVECSKVPIERSTQTYPLETAIWAHWRSCKGDAKDQQTFNKVVKIFGILICMDDDEKHEVILDYILEQSSVNVFESTIDHLSISSDDMRRFLKTISKRTVDLTPEALQLLQKYFVTTRFARPECLTKQAFVVLKQFAESFAKLCFRHEVLACDAIAAIFMCERFIGSIYGVNENSPPAFESHNFVGSVDEYMLKFQDWLKSYINKYQDK